MDKYHYIIKIKERKEPYIPDLAAIKEKVKEALVKDKAQRLAKEKIEACLKKLEETYQLAPKSIDFTKSAKEYGLKSDSTDLFTYGSYIEGVGVADNFWLEALELKVGAFSEIIDMPAGLYIIKIKSRVPVDDKKFQAEKEEFAQKLLLQKKQEYFTKVLEDLKRKAQFFKG
jgi:parvulin-like peptidyl-prolyl isomerase